MTGYQFAARVQFLCPWGVLAGAGLLQPAVGVSFPALQHRFQRPDGAAEPLIGDVGTEELRADEVGVRKAPMRLALVSCASAR
jgi:hypothetical protein